MKPTTDIVEELRLYNRWRRGDEAITAPDPTALGKLIDDAADRIEHLFASGIHTCHADCQRPLCVMRRERDKAQNDLARVTAELEHHKSVKETIDSAHKELSREHAALRARVAELEAQIERDAWTLSPEMVQTRNDQLAAKLEQAEQRNAELEAALRDAFHRHILAQASGEVNDPESGLPHAAHVAWNAIALLELQLRKPTP